MSCRINIGAHAIVHAGIGPVFALPFFVLHHAPLFIQRFLRDRAEEIAHAIAFHPECHVQRPGRNRCKVIGPVFGGRAVHARRTGLGERRKVLAFPVLRALKHQVLEEVGKPGPAGRFVLGPNAVPDTDINRSG